MDWYLAWVCLVAFIAVFALLSVFAVLMRVLIMAFPERESALPATAAGGPRPSGRQAVDAATVAAIGAAATSLYPGMRVTRIEETTDQRK